MPCSTPACRAGAGPPSSSNVVAVGTKTRMHTAPSADRHARLLHYRASTCGRSSRRHSIARASDDRPPRPPPPAEAGSSWEDLTDDEVDDRIAIAAGLINNIDELRPVSLATYNPCYAVWRALARIPPVDRWRVLDVLSPGAIRSLWRASQSRYVLDAPRAFEILGSFSALDDFPSEPGQVFTYEGRCEGYVNTARAGGQVAAGGRGSTAATIALPSREPEPAVPLLQPLPSSPRLPEDSFTLKFFRRPGSGDLQARVLLPLFAGLGERWWLPSYCRVSTDLALTPLEEDGGADLQLVYAEPEGRPLDLTTSDLPSGMWPEPRADGWSPFSQAAADYVRPAAPGVYVGCAYRREPSSRDYVETNFVYFVFARRY